MQIRANAWHLRVFMQAFVNDRYWLDAGIANPTEQPEFLEAVAYGAFEKEYNELPEKQRYSKETQKKLRKFAEASHKAYTDWRKQQEGIYMANKSREVGERLYAGKMSLCPYFWSVISALVFYYGIVHTTRPFRQLFSRLAPTIGYGLVGLFVAGLVGMIGYGIYESREQIPTPSKIMASYRAQQEENRQMELEQQKRVQEQAEYDKTHPEEVLARQKQDEEYRRQAEIWRVQNKAAEWQRTKNEFKELASGIGVLVLGVAGIILSIVLLYYVGKLLGKFSRFLGGLLIPIAVRLSFKNVPETGFRAWVLRLCQRIAQAWAVWRGFWNDTKELVAAFAKAKKEKVCPYLHISNGQDHSAA